MERERRSREANPHGAASGAVQRVPGKTTLTGALTAHAGSASGDVSEVVQARGEPDGPGVHEAAARGVAGTPTQLPYDDQIQRLFGHHDIGGIGAHVGGSVAAATGAIGAKAYAAGNQVAFGAQPDLHTAAHEAAHVVQQRGGVQLAGGVGQSGDTYEQHADAVADAVVAGRSAQALLDPFAGGGAPTAGVQRQVPPAGGPPAAPLTPVERCLDGQDPFTRALAEQAMVSYGVMSAADRAAWITRWAPRGHLSDMTHALARADIAVGGRFENTLRDILQRTQRTAANDQARLEGLADDAAVVQAQANEMIARNTAAAAAARPAGAPPPTPADVAAQQQHQVSETSIAPQTRTLTPAREARLTRAANTAVTRFVDWVTRVTRTHPELHITAAHFRVAVREVWDRGDGIIAFADQGGAPRCVIGESFTQAATANPAYALPTVVHELWGHNEYGPYAQPDSEQGLEIYDRSAALMPGYVRPAEGSAERTSEIDAYAYQETEMYSLMREVEFYTPNAPRDRAALDSINYDPAPTIATRIGLIKTQFEARVARSIVRGLYQRYRMDPRLVPAAIAAFTAGVRSNFPAPEATQILR
jgi:hypothetical protein